MERLHGTHPEAERREPSDTKEKKTGENRGGDSRPERRPRSPREMLGSMAMLVCCLLLVLVGGTRLVRYIGASLNTRRTNGEVQALYQAGLAARTAQATEQPRLTSTPNVAQATETPWTTENPQATAAPDTAATPMVDTSSVMTLSPPYLLEYHLASGAILPELEGLHKTNKDLIGWLSIDGVLNLPVVYRNNSYYMDHDFYGEESISGTVFLDVHHALSRRAQNLLLYGHNMRDGSMFGHLTHYQDRSYYQSHAFIDFATLYERERYVIFAVMEVSTDPRQSNYVNFAGHSSFASVEAFDAYLEEVSEKSLYQTSVEVSANDALLTLATCHGDNRLVLLARRVRDGENEAVLQQQVKN